MTVILSVIFFLSGASALIFETLWFQLAGLTFGNSVWAASIVLSSFMGGMALGSGFVAFRGHKVKAPVLVYALLEVIIATSGFLLVLVLPKLTPIFAPVYRLFLNNVFILNSLRGIIAFGLMFIPASAMGATLPILVKALYSKDQNFGHTLGVLYGWNTLGATIGVITCELLFIGLFGIRGAGFLAAGFNLIAAIIAIWFYKTSRKISLVSTESLPKTSLLPKFSGKTIRLLSASFLSGFTLLALEVIWFRFMLLFFNSTSWNFAIMLAMVLSGISLGGLFASKCFQLRSNVHRFLMPASFFNGILVILTYTNFGFVHDIFKQYGEDMSILFTSLFLIFPISFISGNIFTMLGKELHAEMNSETKAAGLLTLTNTIGGMGGSLIVSLVFIPRIGVEKAFFLFAFTYGIIALLTYDKKQVISSERRITFRHLATGTYIICLMIFPFGVMEVHYLTRAIEEFSKSEKTMAIREGITETIQYLQKDLLTQPYYHRLVTNGHSMSGTKLSAKRYMKLFVYLPVAIHRNIKDAALICFGCGMTAKAMTDTQSLENIEIVDISKDIIEGSEIVFPDPRENPINDPRVNIHIEDGRFFLLTTEQKFDLITAEPPPPKFTGIVNLYTQEYFQLLYDRLSEGGIVTYWLPVYQLSVAESKSILKGFCNVFKDCSLWTGSEFEWMMVGTKNPKNSVAEKDFSRQWSDPIIGPEIRSLGFENPEQMGSFFIADGPRMHHWISDSLPLTDNYPRRLSSRLGAQPTDAYADFMDDAASRTNFVESESIARIWPESFRKKAEEYFLIRRTINELLAPTTRRKLQDVVYLHKCIHNPLLTNYVLWALDSDQYAQKIVSDVIKEFDELPAEIYVHLTAAALMEKDYLLAEHQLSKFVELGIRERSLEISSYYKYSTIRMYLLFMAGDQERAMQVGQEYIHHIKENKIEREQQIEKYWNWLLHAF